MPIGRVLVSLVVFALLGALISIPGATAQPSPQVTVTRVAAAPDVRPGPAILHADPPSAPQLEAVGIWQAPTLLVSGASAYVGGEFLYTDYLYDDLGDGAYTYPDGDGYTRNDADLVEVRLREIDDDLAVRLTFQSMRTPALVGTTLALGDSPDPVAMPHGANTLVPAAVFVTVHGDEAIAVDAATGNEIPATMPVATDLVRRQVEVRIPRAVYDPPETMRIAAASGLWDADTDAYLSQDVGGSAFFNAAFRYEEDGNWFAADQGAAIGAGDLSAFHADIDVAKLRAGTSDSLVGTQMGAPSTGYVGRIYASHVELAQGRGQATVPTDGVAGGGQPTPENCPEDCVLAYPNQLQPYGLYIPDGEPPARGWGLTIDLHGANGNYTSMMFSARGEQLGNAGERALVLYPSERGEVNTYYGQAEADTFEAWAALARSYALDATRVTITGGSMGGVGTYKYAVEYPDLFAAAAPVVGYPYAWIGYSGPPDGMQTTPNGEYTIFYSALASLRNVPLQIWNGYPDELVQYTAVKPVLDLLEELGYPYLFRGFPLEHFGVGIASTNDSSPIADFFADSRVISDPHHVTYVKSSNFQAPRYGLDPDHAYWVSGVQFGDVVLDDPYGSAATFGHVDVFSHGFGQADPQPLDPAEGVGTAVAPHTVITRDVADAEPIPVQDKLDITLSNVSAVTIDVRRARVTCDAELAVESDGPVEITLAGCSDAPQVVRLAGPDRTSTAVAVSRGTFPGGAPVAVLARADVYADALAGGPLAAALGGPLLLTNRDTLPAHVATELDRLGAGTVVLLGGEAALTPSVADRVAGSRRTPTVERVGGTDRFDTAARILQRLPRPASTAYVTLGRHADPSNGWPDALSAAPLAAATGGAVLLTDAAVVPDATLAALAAGGFDEVVVVGGPEAISEGVFDQLAATEIQTRRVAGATRYETSGLLRQHAVDAGADPGLLYVATGAGFADGLTAAPAVAAAGGTFLLLDPRPGAPTPRIDSALHTIVVVGGTASLPDAAVRVLIEGLGVPRQRPAPLQRPTSG